MKEYKVVNKTFVKSHNSVNKMMIRYTYSLIIYIIILAIINLFLGNRTIILNMFKMIIFSLVISSIISYLLNIIKKKTNFIKIYTEDNTLLIALLLGICGMHSTWHILLVAIIVTFILKHILKNINISSSLYGLLIINIYNMFNNNINVLNYLKDNSFNVSFNEAISYAGGIINYLFGINNIAPLLAILVFIYLFYKKSVKYNIVISYIFTLSMMFLLYGIVNQVNIGLAFIMLFGDSLLFLVVYLIGDYIATPTIKEGQIIYGITLAIMTFILRFTIPEISIILPMIIGTFLLSKLLDNYSYKLKYNRKCYSLIISLLIIIACISVGIIYFI